jgi:hypothetical protein
MTHQRVEGQVMFTYRRVGHFVCRRSSPQQRVSYQPAGTVRCECVSFNTLPHKEIRPALSDAGRVPLSQRADPVAESDLAEVATEFD